MAGIDWRELYANNQAAIARAGVKPSQRLNRPLPGRLPGGGAPVRAGEKPVCTLAENGRRALVHVPRGLDATRPAPLVCMLHGCTQTPATFEAATLMNAEADRHGFVVVYPGQERSRNPQGCWNWFLPEHQQRDVGEPGAIAGIVRDLLNTNSRCTIDPERVFVAGLSAGGGMAAILGACYADLFAAVAVHSGLAYRSATSIGSALDAMKRGAADGDVQGHAAHAAMGTYARPLPSIVIHGTADSTVAPANAIQVLRQSMTANRLAAPGICDHQAEHPTSSSSGHDDGGHPYTQSQWRDARGALWHELLMVDGLGHAWSGGSAGGSHTDPRGPSATRAIWTFFAATFADASLD
jgi:poly(hydroxyalkanoate) depolymerase family esterase